MCTACGGSDDDDRGNPSPDRRSPAERVVRGWSSALNRDDFAAAAGYFAPGALIEQTERFRLRSRRAALAFNRSLPCRGRVTKVRDEGETAVATFTLDPAPGSRPPTCDGVVRVRFRARGGKFVEWRQLRDARGSAGHAGLAASGPSHRPYGGYGPSRGVPMLLGQGHMPMQRTDASSGSFDA